ncbi:MAG: MerR family transcriptional regulator [Verrucomicrobiota bacterium]
MNPSPANDPDAQETYTLDLVAKLTGVSSQTILHYQEQGLIHPAGSAGDFDDETIHTLRRIEHLRRTSEANLTGIKLILQLLDEVDRLHVALRTRR